MNQKCSGCYRHETLRGVITSYSIHYTKLYDFIIIVVNLVRSARKGAPAEANPWHGRTLEWTVPSPPPVLNFDEEPVIGENDGPYNYE